MELTAFTMPNGNLVKNLEDDVAFVPKLLPPQIAYDTDMINLLAKAGEKVGELRGVGEFVSNPSMFIKRYIRNEAVLSSKIEGTIATIKDILQYSFRKCLFFSYFWRLYVEILVALVAVAIVPKMLLDVPV